MTDRWERLHDSSEIWLRVYCAAIAGGSDSTRALQAAEQAVPMYAARFRSAPQPLPDPPEDEDGLMKKGL